ncbi:MAG: DUF2332 domain-containing protein [Alphaproteobacteria bacterium]|nr:DUF2332 domain-containing protein [Alphaproteobacteria bacterium]
MEPAVDYWEFFAGEARRAGAPLYEKLSLAVGGDEVLRQFATAVRAGQPPANILFGAVHFLLLQGAEHPLRNFYRNLGGTAQGDPVPVFRDFVRRHREELAPIMASRVTNTNEVARSALLAPAFRVVAQEAGEPLHLIEIGPSAGFNLAWDRYSVRYHRNGAVFPCELADADLTIDCALRGDKTPPHGRAPQVASRIGLERSPVDLADPGQRDWLRALVWPDQIDRFARLDKAIAAALRSPRPIRAGDALALLPEALAAAPEHEAVCVYHSLVLYQFSDEMREAFAAMLLMASLRRPVWRVSLESTLKGECPLLIYSYRDGSRTKRQLARCNSHGEWIEWLA